MRYAWVSSVCSIAMLIAPAADAQLGGLLDRAKRRANEAAAEAREVRRDVDEVTNVERRAENEVGRARSDVEQAVPTAERLERRVENEIERTEPVQAGRELERDVVAVTTADERAAAAVRAEANRTERELERQTDVEGRARGAAESSDAGVAARRVERDARAIATADERAAAEIERDVREIGRALEDATSLE